jgi:hypothetical protein
MRPWVAVVAAAAVLAVLAPISTAQSLAEVAAKTRKKDADKSKPAKVYTETDLRGSGSGAMSQMEGPDSTATATPSPAPGAAPANGEVPKSEEEQRAEKMTEWRGRLAHAESEVTRITGEIDRAQTALNDFSGPMYGGNRAAAITRLEEGKKQLALAQQSVLDIQEEGRRARYR